MISDTLIPYFSLGHDRVYSAYNIYEHVLWWDKVDILMATQQIELDINAPLSISGTTSKNSRPPGFLSQAFILGSMKITRSSL